MSSALDICILKLNAAISKIKEHDKLHKITQYSFNRQVLQMSTHIKKLKAQLAIKQSTSSVSIIMYNNLDKDELIENRIQDMLQGPEYEGIRHLFV